jgi:thioesterase domain-containing protein
MEELVEPPTQQHARELLRTNKRVWVRYDPPRYGGTVTLIRSAEYGARQRWHDETWEELAGNVESHVVPGDHHQILREPWVAAVADVVRGCLRDAQIPV